MEPRAYLIVYLERSVAAVLRCASVGHGKVGRGRVLDSKVGHCWVVGYGREKHGMVAW